MQPIKILHPVTIHSLNPNHQDHYATVHPDNVAKTIAILKNKKHSNIKVIPE